MQYHQLHHAILWNDSERQKREPIRGPEYGEVILVLRLVTGAHLLLLDLGPILAFACEQGLHYLPQT